MTEPRLAGALIQLDTDLRAIGAQWALIGGLAVSARTEPRTTRDIDVSVAVQDDRQAESIVREMTSQRIAEDCRDLQPSLVLVDDAHLDPEKLDRLRQIRGDIGADFEIVASSWPGAEDGIADALGGLGRSSIRHLKLLTRKEIVEVLRSIGINEPSDDSAFRLLVEQAANKPGLAVTLGSLWLRGEWRDLITGKALKRTLIPTLKRVLEHDPTQLLACFALGGDRGLNLETVARFLQQGRGEIHHRATGAAHGGVLAIRGQGFLSVEPELLRSALLGEVFFKAPALPYRELLKEAPAPGEAVETLAFAALRGVEIPRWELQELIAEHGSRKSWQAFAGLGEAEARWVLEKYPGPTATIAPYVLNKAPRPMIRRLLREAVGAAGALHSHASHPLRILQDWLHEIPERSRHRSRSAESLRRRRLVVDESLKAGIDRAAGLRACFLALSLRLESRRETATGSLAIRMGILPVTSVPEMLELWALVFEKLDDLSPDVWPELESCLRSWVWPRTFDPQPTDVEKDRYHDMARRMIHDLRGLTRNRPGLWAALQKLATEVDLPPDGARDSDFAILFPYSDSLEAEDWREKERKQREASGELALRWSDRPAREVSRQLAFYAREARDFGHSFGVSSAFFLRLAAITKAPERWLEAFIDQRLPAEWLEPLLDRVVSERRPGWDQILRQSLASSEYALLASWSAVRSSDLPEELLDAALREVPPSQIETACLRGEVSTEVLRALLEHSREDISLAAAVGEWLAEPRGEVRKSLRSAWRQVILRWGATGEVGMRVGRRGHEAHWLTQILESDPELATRWERRQSKRDTAPT